MANFFKKKKGKIHFAHIDSKEMTPAQLRYPVLFNVLQIYHEINKYFFDQNGSDLCLS